MALHKMMLAGLSLGLDLRFLRTLVMPVLSVVAAQPAVPWNTRW